jgi:PAS domain S-box-containing protein
VRVKEIRTRPLCSILIVDDDPAHVVAIERVLRGTYPGITIEICETLAAYRSAADARPPDIALVDLNLPDGRAIDILRTPAEQGMFPVVVMTSQGNEEVAVAAMKAGALDYVVKSADTFAGIQHTLQRVLREWDLRKGHRHAVEALQASETRLRALYEDSPLGYQSLDAEGLLLDVNPRWIEMLGYSQEKVLGRWFGDFLAEEDPVSFRERYLGFLAAGRAEGEVLHLRRKDGALLIVSLDGRVGLHPDGSFWCMHCLLRDVTEETRLVAERARFEEAVRQRQKLESIGILASGVAHEINNPLNIIMNYGQLILDDPENPITVKEFADNIVKESERVAVIVRSLLKFARQERESHGPTQLAAVVEITLSLLHGLLRKDQITVECAVPADLPTVRCRPQQIQQVLMNLLTNARDAVNLRFPTPSADKTIRIEASAFLKDGVSWVRLTVADNGIGILPGVAGKVFDPFFSTKTRDKGSGLGLSISYGIVNEHGGELRFESEPGAGTRFHVELPTQGEGPAGNLDVLDPEEEG